MRNVVQSMSKAAMLLVLLLLGACAGTSGYMENVDPSQANYAPEPDKALIVFMRPSGFGFAVQSSVFDITDGIPQFIGIVPAKKKIAHYAPPGHRLFMVIGESANFMGADLDVGKVYYAQVTPQLGWWKARFSLEPVHSAELKESDFSDWFTDTQWVKNGVGAKKWSTENMQSILAKKARYLPDWQSKPMLHAADGQDHLYKPPADK